MSFVGFSLHSQPPYKGADMNLICCTTFMLILHYHCASLSPAVPHVLVLAPARARASSCRRTRYPPHRCAKQAPGEFSAHAKSFLRCAPAFPG